MEALLIYLLEEKLIEKIDKNTNRWVREIIGKEPKICSCKDGYFWGENKEDVQHSINYLLFTYLVSVGRKIKKKKDAYPEFYGKNDGQLGLYNEDNLEYLMRILNG